MRVPMGTLSKVAILFVLAGCQSAPGSANFAYFAFEEPEPSTPMAIGKPEGAPPAGFVSFCLRNPDQCLAPDQDLTIIHLDGVAWATLRRTNSMVNASIAPEEDDVHYGIPEYWTFPIDHRGDCDDYAVTKRMELGKAGLPIRALRLAIAMTPLEERHVVLTIATDKGDYVLDNLTDQILPWNKTGYTWVARQDPHDVWGWVAFETTPLPAR